MSKNRNKKGNATFFGLPVIVFYINTWCRGFYSAFVEKKISNDVLGKREIIIKITMHN